MAEDAVPKLHTHAIAQIADLCLINPLSYYSLSLIIIGQALRKQSVLRNAHGRMSAFGQVADFGK